MDAATAGRGGPFGGTRRTPHARWSARGPAAAPFESSPSGGARLVAALIVAVALAGAASVASGGWIHAKALAGQWLLERAWTRTRDGHPARPWPWADTRPIARLLVPAVDGDVLVLEGASGRTLAWGPGHLDASAPMGSGGHAVVSAHRDTHFRFLRDIAIGDDVVVELPDGARRHFSVRRTYVADARTLELPRTTPVPTLTLVTCYPFDAVVPNGPGRYVVVAEAR
jgi:sortase A